MSSKDISHFVLCKCGCDAIKMEYIHEVGFEPVVYITFWAMLPEKSSFWRRLKRAVAIMTRGDSEYPEIVVGKEEMLGMIDVLTRVIVESELDSK